MFKTNSETKEFIGLVLAAKGLGAVGAGIIIALCGQKQGMNIALAGTIGTAAASIPLCAASWQRDEEYMEAVRSRFNTARS